MVTDSLTDINYSVVPDVWLGRYDCMEALDLQIPEKLPNISF